MIDQLAVDPSTFTHAPVWLYAFGVAGATGLGYKAFRFGHDRVGPLVEEVLL